jgi:hypothetical protein
LVVLEIDFVVSGQEGKGKVLIVFVSVFILKKKKSTKKFNKKIRETQKDGCQKKDNKLFIFLKCRHNE